MEHEDFVAHAAKFCIVDMQFDRRLEKTAS
jgi:hypothetical protein